MKSLNHTAGAREVIESWDRGDRDVYQCDMSFAVFMIFVFG